MRRLSVVEGIVIALLSTASFSVQAQSPPNEALAESLFLEGRELLAAKKIAEACIKFSSSYEVDNALGTLLNLAVCHEQEGKTASAWLEFTRAAGMSLKSNEKAREKVARDHARALVPKLLRLVVNVTDKTPGLELRLDSWVVPENTWKSAIPVDPGEHKVEAMAPAKEKWTQLLVVDQAHPRQQIDVPVLQASVVTSTPSTSRAESVRAIQPLDLAPNISKPTGMTHSKAKRISAYSLAGVAFALGSIAIVEQVRIGKSKTDMEKLKASDSGSLDPEKELRYFELKASAHRTTNWRTISAIGAGASAVGSGALFWLSLSPPGHTASASSNSPGVSLVMGGTF